MSSLWTPEGEHRVGPQQAPAATPPPPRADDALADDALDDELDPATAEAVMAEMARVREQLAEVPAEVVVANHAMGLYELAAIHLSQDPPSLGQAKLAIDAVGCLVEGLRGRLGEPEATLLDALTQIRLAFVQIQGATGATD